MNVKCVISETASIQFLDVIVVIMEVTARSVHSVGLNYKSHPSGFV